MAGPAADVIRQFAAVEHDQRYSRLAELFTPDAIYYDPFKGPQRGDDAIASFLAEMEVIIPRLGVRFEDREVHGDTTCGWSRWRMIARGDDEAEHSIHGQSIYRLRDGKVCFVADYVDPVAYGRLRPTGPRPDNGAAAGLSATLSTGSDGTSGEGGAALALLRRFWEIQSAARYRDLAPLFADDAVFTDLIYGRMEGIGEISAYLERMEAEMPGMGVYFELVDAAGDDTVGWSQWNAVFPTGTVPGWSLHTVRDGRFTLDSDYFDTVRAREVQSGRPPVADIT